MGSLRLRNGLHTVRKSVILAITMASKSETDVLSALLQVIRLDAAFFFNAEFSAPWTVRTPVSSDVAPMFLPAARHLIMYHLLIGGSGYACLGDGPRVALVPGDIVMFPHGDAHVMGAGLETNLIPAADTFSHWTKRGLEVARFGGGGAITTLICGYLSCEPQLSSVVLSGLPRMIKVNIRGDSIGDWLESSIQFSVKQASTPDAGSQAVLTRLSEALFVETVRRYVQQLPAEQSGWIAGIRDPEVAKTLALIHQNPRRAWRIADLASEIGTSRSVLADRFTRHMGEPPMSYLTRWRLQLGAQMLAGSSHSVSEIAAEVGYESEAAFNRAFKRTFDLPPARYRSKLKEGRAATHCLSGKDPRTD